MDLSSPELENSKKSIKKRKIGSPSVKVENRRKKLKENIKISSSSFSSLPSPIKLSTSHGSIGAPCKVSTPVKIFNRESNSSFDSPIENENTSKINQLKSMVDNLSIQVNSIKDYLANNFYIDDHDEQNKSFS